MQEVIAVPNDTKNTNQNFPQYFGWLGFLLIISGLGFYFIWKLGFCKPVFKSIVETQLISTDDDRYSKTIDISQMRTFSFLLHNEGPNPVVAQLELSPNGVIWDSFGELAYTIRPGGIHLVVPQFFLRYARIKFRNRIPGLGSKITVWFQGQS
jgi:hypothetical protein